MSDENGREFKAYINPDDEGRYLRIYKDTGEEVYADNLKDVCSPFWFGQDDTEDIHSDDRNTLPRGLIPRIDENDRPFYIVVNGDEIEKIYLDSYEREIHEDSDFLIGVKGLLEEDYDKYRIRVSSATEISTVPDAPRKTDVTTLFPKTLGYVEPKLEDYNLGEIVKCTNTI